MKNKRFEEAYQKYRRLVMKMIHDYLSDIFLAEEISQQVFMSFYEHLDSIRREEFIRPWLITATKNAIIDYCRWLKVRKNKAVCLYADAAQRAPAAEDEAVEQIANRGISRCILEDLREKNTKWYEIIVAVCVKGMSLQTASENLRMTPQVLNARLYRARQYIRNKYRDEYDEVFVR